MKVLIAAMLTAQILCAAVFAADTPKVEEIEEIREMFRGDFFLRSKIVGGKAEKYDPDKPFGRIETKRIAFSDGKVLTVSLVKEMTSDKGIKTNLVFFENADFFWVLAKGKPPYAVAVTQAYQDKDEAIIFALVEKK